MSFDDHKLFITSRPPTTPCKKTKPVVHAVCNAINIIYYISRLYHHDNASICFSIPLQLSPQPQVLSFQPLVLFLQPRGIVLRFFHFRPHFFYSIATSH